jgi:hypothetical protein
MTAFTKSKIALGFAGVLISAISTEAVTEVEFNPETDRTVEIHDAQNGGTSFVHVSVSEHTAVESWHKENLETSLIQSVPIEGNRVATRRNELLSHALRPRPVMRQASSGRNGETIADGQHAEATAWLARQRVNDANRRQGQIDSAEFKKKRFMLASDKNLRPGQAELDRLAAEAIQGAFRKYNRPPAEQPVVANADADADAEAEARAMGLRARTGAATTVLAAAAVAALGALIAYRNLVPQ